MSSATHERAIKGYAIVRRVPDKDREVYLAKKNGADTPGVVLVVTELDGSASGRFEHEVRRCLDFAHPAFTNVLDYFRDNHRQVVAFEHVEGTSLHRLMRYVDEQDERLGDGAVLHIGVGLLAALNHAHAAKTDDGKAAPIIHGQLGPHQVLISWEGEVKVMGFGLSVMFENAGAAPSWLLPYTAPEVRDGRPHSARANVYAAGAMMWTLLARKPLPEDGSRPQPLRKVRPDLPPSVTFPLDRALEPEPGKRISAKALQVGLTRAIEDADREELRWAMEVCRVRCTVEEEFLPQESLPPSHSGVPISSSRSLGSSPPDSDAPTGVTDQRNLLEKARVFGPLPWEEEQTADKDPPSRKARPSGRPRPAPRRRRRLDEGADDASRGANGADPEAQMTLPAPRDARRDDTLAAGAPPEVADEGHDEGIPVSYGAPASGYPIGAVPPSGYHPSQFPPGVVWTGAPSSYAPGSAYPYPVGPSGHAMPPLGYPGTQYPVHASVPAKWIVAVVVTALGSFLVGILVSSGLKLRFGPEESVASPTPPAAAPAPTPTATVAAAAPTAAPAPVDPPPVAASSEPSEAVETDEETAEAGDVEASSPDGAEESAEPSEESAEPVSTEPVVASSAESAGLPAHKAHLLVHTDIKDAHVYVHGKYAGPVGQRHEVDCGMKYVRLGTSPNSGWLEPGRAFEIPCRTFVTVTIEPRPYWNAPPRSQFLK